MSFKIEHTKSNVSAVFKKEHWTRCAGPLDPEFAHELSKLYGFKDVVVHSGPQGIQDRLLWLARNGYKTLGKRRIRIGRAHGNELELAVEVDGETEDALDALRELWTDLGAISGLDDELDDADPAYDYNTVTSVESDRSFTDLFGAFSAGLTATRAAMGSRLSDESGAVWSMRFPLTVSLYGWRVDRWLLVERRAGSPLDDRRFHVASPLKSNDHRAVLEALFGS